jgi:hypothetical protein
MELSYYLKAKWRCQMPTGTCQLQHLAELVVVAVCYCDASSPTVLGLLVVSINVSTDAFPSFADS